MANNKLIVGQTVWVKKNTGFFIPEMSEAKVEYVGRKYFKLNTFHKYKFYVSTLMDNGRGIYTSSLFVYTDEQKLKDEIESKNNIDFIMSFIREICNGKEFPLSELREIKYIIDKFKIPKLQHEILQR